VQNKLRKWRSKQQCKICKNKRGDCDDSKYVLKCANTKCKSYFHIPCAIEKNLIVPLEFMTDYYGFGRERYEQYSKEIPFYCSLHNRQLNKAYQEFVEDMEKCLISSHYIQVKDNDNTCHSIIKEHTDELTKDDCSLSHLKNDENFELEHLSEQKNIESDKLSFKSLQIEDMLVLDKSDNFKTNEKCEEKKENFVNFDFIESAYSCKSTDLLHSENILERIKQNENDVIYNSFSFCNYATNKENNYSGLNFFSDKSDNSNLNKNCQQLISTILPQKPKYQSDDSYYLNLNLPTFSSTPEYNFINIENNNNFNLNFESQDVTQNSVGNDTKQNFKSISKSFYDYFNSDIEKIKSEGFSNVTLTQLQDLKDFFVRILENYNKYNPELKKIYYTLQDGKIV
jgi:hypothetical protein